MKVVERIFWIIGGALTFTFLGGLTVSEYSRVNGINQFREQLASANDVVEQPVMFPGRQISDEPNGSTGRTGAFEIDFEEPDQSLWSTGRITEFEESQEGTAGDVLGLLEIPSLGLEVPLYDGASDLHMNLGIARISGTARPGHDGNLGIAGHRDGYFRVLQDIQFGDELHLTTLDGVFKYRVEELKIVDPSAVDVLDDRGRASITLVTCYPFYFVGHAPERFIVHAALQET